jgi:hypothetical protein
MSAIFKMAAKIPFEPLKNDFDPLYHKAENFRTNSKHISITPQRLMKFCPVVQKMGGKNSTLSDIIKI